MVHVHPKTGNPRIYTYKAKTPPGIRAIPGPLTIGVLDWNAAVCEGVVGVL